MVGLDTSYNSDSSPAEAPLSAGELSELYDVSNPTMSVHFKTLKESDLIYSERNGNHIIYHLNTTVSEEALILFASLLGSDKNGETQ